MNEKWAWNFHLQFVYKKIRVTENKINYHKYLSFRINDWNNQINWIAFLKKIHKFKYCDFFYWLVDDFLQYKIEIDLDMQNLCKFHVCLLTLFDCRNNEDNICSKTFADSNICNCIADVCKILKCLTEQDLESLLQSFTLFSNIIWIDHEICMHDVIQFYDSSMFCFFLKTDVEILTHSCYVLDDCYYSYSVCKDMNKLIVCLVFLIHNVLSFSSNWHIRKEEF